MKKIFFSIIGLISIKSAFAQGTVPCPDGTMADPAIGCVKSPEAIVSSQSSLLNILLKVGNGVVSIAIVLAVIILIYGGIQYSLSMGNEEKMGQSKSILFWAVFGLIVALLAKYLVWSIISFLQ
jgi:hypothetical protein